jgi:hypothetical protein
VTEAKCLSAHVSHAPFKDNGDVLKEAAVKGGLADGKRRGKGSELEIVETARTCSQDATGRGAGISDNEGVGAEMFVTAIPRWPSRASPSVLCLHMPATVFGLSGSMLCRAIDGVTVSP